MNESFKQFEQAIDRAGARYPGSPRQEILLTRLYYHIIPRLNNFFNDGLRQYGLNETLYLALMSIFSAENHAIGPSHLSDVLDSSRTNITRVADELVRNGWVSRETCSEDRRRLYLKLTPEGLKMVEQLLPEIRVMHRSLWGSFTETEKVAMEGLMRKLLATLGG